MVASPNLPSPTIFTLEITPDELANHAFVGERLSSAVEALRADGIIVLENAVSPNSIQMLRSKMLDDVEKILARSDTPYNWTKGNIQQAPPPYPPYLFRDVLVNDFAIAITKSILGEGMRCGFYSGNTALPSEARQPVHADEGQLWPNLASVPPAHSIVVNVPLVDMGPENGSTEMWPGTHLDPSVVKQSGDIVVSEEVLKARQQVAPPIQPVVKAGSLVIRDIRMWHAGMPNRTTAPRPMIAMVHSISWIPTDTAVFAEGSEPFLTHPDLHWEFKTQTEVDHISASHGFMAEQA